MLAALASSPATKALDPDPFPRHSLRHPVYAALLHFGFETALVITLNNGNIFSIISKNPALGECDGQYVKLYWGQSVEFEFTLPEGTDRKAVIESILNLTGYYEPYSTELAKKNKMVTNIVSRSADYCPAR